MNEEKCKVCGCTNDKACDGGCWWVAKELCSKCANKLIEENVKLKKQLEKLEEKYINNVPCCNEEDCEMFKDYMNLKQQLKDKDELLEQIYNYVNVDNHLGLDMSSKEQGKRIVRDCVLNMFELESNKKD